MINLPSDFATSTLTTAGTTLSGISPLLYVVVGVLLAVAVVALLIGAFRHH